MSLTCRGNSNPTLAELAAHSKRPLAIPIAVLPGLALTGGTVRQAVTSPEAQVAASRALHERYQTRVALSAMDLSVEAEAFGCQLVVSEDEIPTVTGSLVSEFEHAKKLRVPSPGEGRTWVYLETVKGLCALPSRPLVLAGCIGPFSLAARLVGVSEAMMLTVSDQELMHVLVEKSAEFLAAYVRAFQAAGASGVIMAEPAAGLLSPKSLAEFSSAYVRRIVEQTGDAFSLILHNCAAKLVHLPAILQSGARTFHFGAPMDVAEALRRTTDEITICGNLDPAAVFVQGTPEEVLERTTARLAEVGSSRRFIISSGCDIPARAPLENLDAFFRAAGSRT
jgi:uroporphyrinogen decarboxylase